MFENHDIFELAEKHGAQIASDIIVLRDAVKRGIFCQGCDRKGMLYFDSAHLLIIHHNDRDSRFVRCCKTCATDTIQGLIDEGYAAKKWTIVSQSGMVGTTFPQYENE